jgi:hypothetical protein
LSSIGRAESRYEPLDLHQLYVDGDTIVGHELREPFNVLAEAYSIWQGYPHQTDTTPGTRPRATLSPPHCPTPTTQ